MMTCVALKPRAAPPRPPPAAHAVERTLRADRLAARGRHEFSMTDETDKAFAALRLAAIGPARADLAWRRGGSPPHALFFDHAVKVIFARLAAAFEDTAARFAALVAGPIVGRGHDRVTSEIVDAVHPPQTQASQGPWRAD